jgi:ATP-dependent helicase/DNAse subunit B
MKKLVIAPYLGQRVLFKRYRAKDIFDDVKFITKQELIANFYYDYSDEAVKYTINKYKQDLDYAKRLLNNIVYLDEYKEEYKELFAYKDELIHKGLLVKNELFTHELENSDIYVHYYHDDPIIDKILKGYKYQYVEEKNEKVNDILVFNNNDDQLFYVFNKIEELLHDGISPNKIFLYGLTEDDEVIFDRLMKNYHINFNNAYKKKLINLKQVRDFVSNYSGNFEAAISFIQNDFPEYDEVIRLINEYHFEEITPELQKAIYKQLFMSQPTKKDRYVEAINIISEPIINEDEYLFIVNYAQGIIPNSYRDDDILDDSEKKELGIIYSMDKNTAETNYFINTLRQKGNIYFSYAKKNYSSKFMASPLKNQLKQEVVEPIDIKKVFSFKEARIQYANKLDLHRKYLHTDSVYNAYKKKDEFKSFDYQTYDPQVENIQRYGFSQVLDISYTSVKSFYECQYKYYLDKVAKVDEFNKSFNLVLGNIGHRIMEWIEKPQSFDDLYEDAFNEQAKDYNFSVKELVLLKRLKEELRKTYEFIKEHEAQIVNKFCDRELEFKNFYLDNQIRLTGKVDKVIYSGDKRQYLTIIDYKTGSESFNEKNVQYGLSLQLPTYALFAINDKSLKDKQIIALTIQPLLSKTIGDFCDADIEKYKSGLKMNGAYLDSQEVLYTIDKNIFTKSVYLGGVTINQSGPIKAGSKVYSQEWFVDKANTAKNLILSAGHKILANDFRINPKMTGGKNVSCQYCDYKDICYHDNRHLIVLDHDEEEEGN